MATYKPIGPGLLEVRRDDGQTITLPMQEQEAQAQGLTPEIPHNPYGMAGSPQAVAGPGGVTLTAEQIEDLQAKGVYTPEQANQAKIDNGAFRAAPMRPDPVVAEGSGISNEKIDQAVARGTMDAQRAEQLKAQNAGAGGAPPLGTTAAERAAPTPQSEPTEHPAQEIARGLIPVGGGAPQGQGPAAPPSRAIDPVVLEAMRASGGGGGPARLGMVSETKKYHEAGPVDPALMRDIEQRQDEVSQGQSNLLEDQAVHKLDYLEQQQGLQQEQARQVQVAMQRRQAVDNEVQRLGTQSQTDQDALRLAKPKTVDDFWRERGVAAQISSVIAVALGAWGATIAGGENQGLKILNQTIDRWTNDQVQGYETAKDKASLSNNAYKDALNTYGSPELAQTNLQLQANAAKMALLQNQAEQIGTPDALAQAQQGLKETELQQARLRAQAQAQAGADVEAKFTVQQSGGGGNPVLSALRRGAEATRLSNEINGVDPKANAAAASDARGRQVRLANGDTAYVTADNARKDVQTAIDGRTDIISKLEKLHQMQQNSNLVTDMKARAEYDALAAAVKSQATVLAGQGAMSAGDERNVTNGIPESGMHIKDAAAALQATIAGQRASLDSTIRGNVYRDPDATQPYAAPQAGSFKPGL